MDALRRLILLPLLLVVALNMATWTVAAHAAPSLGAAPCHDAQTPDPARRDGVLTRLACALHCAGCLAAQAPEPARAAPHPVRPQARTAPLPAGRAPDRLDRPPKRA